MPPAGPTRSGPSGPSRRKVIEAAPARSRGRRLRVRRRGGEAMGIESILGSMMSSALGGNTPPQSSQPLGAILGAIGGTGGQGPGSNALLSAALGLLQQNGGLQGILGR